MGEEGGGPRAFSWIRDVYENLDYYLGTEEGRRKLEDIARSEAQRLEDEIARVHRPQRNIIWMSKWCLTCSYIRENRGRYYCSLHGARLVKPFHGRPLWAIVTEPSGEAHYVLLGLDWDGRWREVEEYIVNAAMEAINGGRPYYCYEQAGR
ncbi:MAG: hypothetical protein RXP77_01075 [Nitrososphaeria archaeon]